jgi:hypothetical protein
MSANWPDWDGVEEWDEGPELPWLACPDANPQEVRRALGFRERNVGELELRVPFGGNDGGVCQVVEERDVEVHVRLLVCGYDRDDRPPRTYRDAELVAPAFVSGPSAADAPRAG